MFCVNISGNKNFFFLFGIILMNCHWMVERAWSWCEHVQTIKWSEPAALKSLHCSLTHLIARINFVKMLRDIFKSGFNLKTAYKFNEHWTMTSCSRPCPKKKIISIIVRQVLGRAFFFCLLSIIITIYCRHSEIW